MRAVRKSIAALLLALITASFFAACQDEIPTADASFRVFLHRLSRRIVQTL